MSPLTPVHRGRPRNGYRDRLAAQRERGQAEAARLAAAELAFIARARSLGDFTLVDIAGPFTKNSAPYALAQTILARLNRNGKVERCGKRGPAFVWRLVGGDSLPSIPAARTPDDLGSISRKERAWRLLRHLMHIAPIPEITFGSDSRHERAARFKKDDV
jgi:hypothetical protein